jgi:hypothetical protein
MATATAARAPAGARSATRTRAAQRTRPAARRAPAQRTRRARPPAPPARLMPLAVGRATVAVGGLADSSLVQRLTRGRLWIGALATLLVGIVGLNVMALSINASTGKVAAQAEELKRANSALRAQVAGELSNERIQHVAARLGLLVPDPASVLYLRPGADDAQAAARRLASGDLSGAGLVATAPIAPVAPPAAEPPAPTPVEPAEPETTDPAATAPPATAPTADGATAGGGVGAP